MSKKIESMSFDDRMDSARKEYLISMCGVGAVQGFCTGFVSAMTAKCVMNLIPGGPIVKVIAGVGTYCTIGIGGNVLLDKLFGDKINDNLDKKIAEKWGVPTLKESIELVNKYGDENMAYNELKHKYETMKSMNCVMVV